MLIVCKNCGHRYQVPVSIVRSTVVRFPCRQCQHMVEAPSLDELESSQGAYYVVVGERYDGPYDVSALAQLKGLGTIDERTLIWADEYSEWVQLGRTQLLSPELSGRARWWLTVRDPEPIARALGDFLAFRPGDQASVASLKRLMQLDKGVGMASKLLEPTLYSLDDWEGLAELLEVRLSRTQDRGQRQSTRIALASLYTERLAKKDQAFDHLADALGEDPDDRVILDSLIRIEKGPRKQKELVALIRALTVDSATQLAQGRLVDALAELLLDAGAADEVIGLVEPLEQSIGNLQHLSIAYRDVGRWHELASTIEARLELSQDTDEIDLRLELADIYASQLNEGHRALANWSLILDKEPKNLESIEGLLFLAERAPLRRTAYRALRAAARVRGDWYALREHYRREYEGTTVDEPHRGALALELAELLLREFSGEDDPAGLLDDAIRVCERTPDHCRRIVLALSNGDRQTDGLSALEILQRDVNWADHVLPVLLDQPMACRDTFKALLLGLGCQSYDHYLEALKERSVGQDDVKAVVSRLEEIGRDEKWARLHTFYAGQLAVDRLDDPGHGASLFLQFLETNEGNVEGWRSFWDCGRPDLNPTAFVSCVKILGQHAGPGMPAGSDLLFALAQAQRTLGAPLEEAEAWAGLFELGDAHLSDAIEFLAPFYEMHGQWNQLVDVLQRRASLEDGIQRAETLLQLASVLESELDEVHLARTYVQQASMAAGPKPEIHRRELELAERSSDWVDVVRLLADPMSKTDGEAEWSATVRAALIAREQLGDNQLAAELAITGFELGASAGDVAAAIEAELDLGFFEGLAARWAAALSEQLSRPDYLEAHEILAAWLLARELNASLVETFTESEGVLGRSIHCERAVLWAAAAIGDQGQMIASYRRQTAHADQGVASQAAFQLAVHIGLHGDIGSHTDALKKLALGQFSTDWRLRQPFEALMSNSMDWDGLISSLALPFDARSIEERCERLERCGQLVLLHQRDVGIAKDAWSRLLQIGEPTPARLERLMELHRADAEWALWDARAVSLADCLDESEGWVRLLRERARVARAYLDDPCGAGELERLLYETGWSGSADRVRLCRYLLDGGELDAVTALFRVMLESDSGQPGWPELCRDVGRALDQEGVELAALAWDALLRIDPHDVDALRAVVADGFGTAQPERSRQALLELHGLGEDLALEELTHLADMAMGDGDMDAAIRWNQAVQARSFSTGRLKKIADGYRSLGRSSEEYQHLARFVEHRSTRPMDADYVRLAELVDNPDESLQWLLKGMSKTGAHSVFFQKVVDHPLVASSRELILDAWSKGLKRTDDFQERLDTRLTIANFAVGLGRRQKARAALKAVSANPECRFDHWVQIGDLWAELGAAERGASAYARALDAGDGDGGRNLEIELRRARLLLTLKGGQRDACVAAELVRVAGSDALRHAAAALLADVFIEQTDWDGLLRLSRSELASSQVENAQLWLERLARAYEEVGDYRGCAVQLERLLVEIPSHRVAYRSLCRVYGELEDDDALESIYRRRLKYDTESEKPPTLKWLAALLDKRGGSPMARRQAWLDYLEVADGCRDGIEALIAVEIQLGHHLAAFEHALRLADAYPEEFALLERAYSLACHETVPEFEQAQILQRLVWHADTVPEWQTVYGRMLISDGRLDDAFDLLDALKADGRLTREDLVLYATTFCKTERFSQAADLFDSGIVDEMDGSLQRLQLNALHGAGRWEQYYVKASALIYSAEFGLTDLDLARLALERLNDEFRFVKHVSTYLRNRGGIGLLAKSLDVQTLPQGYTWASRTVAELSTEVRFTAHDLRVALGWAKSSRDSGTILALLKGLADHGALSLTEALDACQLYEKQGQIDQAIEAHRYAVECEPRNPTRILAHLDLLIELKGDLDTAIEFGEKTLDGLSGSGCSPVFERHISLLEERGLWSEVLDAQRRWAERIQSPVDAGDILLRRGELAQLHCEPDEVVAAWQLVCDTGFHLDKARRALESAYMSQTRYGKAAEILETSWKAEKNRPEGVEIGQRLIALLEDHLERPQDALRLARDLLLYAPTDRQSLLACHRISHSLEMYTEAVDFGRRLRTTLSIDDPLKPEILRTDARVLGDRLGRWKSAILCWQELLAYQPSDDEAFDALSALHRAAGDQRNLAATLRRRLALMDEPPRDLLYSYAVALADCGDAHREAIDCLDRIAARAPGDLEAFGLARRVLEEEGDWSSLLTRYEALLDIHEQAQRSDLWLEMAAIAHRQIGDNELAIGILGRGVEATGNTAAFADYAFELGELEGAWGSIRDEWCRIGTSRVDHSIKVEARRQILKWSQAGRFKVESMDEIVDWLKSQIPGDENVDRQIIMESRHTTEARRAAFERQLGVAQAWSADYWLEFASLSMLPGGEPHRLSLAIEAARERAETRDHHMALAAIAEKAERYEMAADILGDLQTLADPADALALGLRRANCQLKHGDNTQADAVLNELFRSFGFQSGLVSLVEECSRRTGDNSLLLDVLSARLEAVDSVSQFDGVLELLAAFQPHQRGAEQYAQSVARAIDCLSLNPAHSERLHPYLSGDTVIAASMAMAAFGALPAPWLRWLDAQVDDNAGLPMDLVWLCFRSDPSSDDMRDKLLGRMDVVDYESAARVWEEHAIARGEGGGKAWIEAARLYHQSSERPESASRALDRALESGIEPDAIAELASAIRSVSGDWEQALEHLEVRIGLADDELADRLSLEAADLACKTLGDMRRAIKILVQRLHRGASSQSVCNRLSEIADQAALWGAVFEMLTLSAADQGIEDLKLMAALRSGQTDDVLDGLYYSILSGRPRHLPGLQWFAYRNESDVASRLDYLGRLLAVCQGDKGEALRAWETALELNESIEDDHGSLDALRALSEGWPDQDRYHEHLIDTLYRRGDFEGARNEVARICVGLEPARLATYLRRMVEIAARLSDDRLAAESLGRLIEIQPDDIETRRALVDVCERLQSPAETVHALLGLIAVVPDGEALGELRKAAQLCLDVRVEDVDAKTLWQRVLAVAPTDIAALIALSKLSDDVDQASPYLERVDGLTPAGSEVWVEANRRLSGVTDDSIRGAALDRLIRHRGLPEDALVNAVQGLRASGRLNAVFETYTTADAFLELPLDALTGIFEAMGEVAGAYRACHALFLVAAQRLDQVDAVVSAQHAYTRRTETWSDFVEFGPSIAELIIQPIMREAYLQQLSSVAEERLSQLETALGFVLRAFSIRQDDQRYSADAERLASQLDLWELVVAEWRAGIESAGPMAVNLHQRLARWHLGPAFDETRARLHFRRVVDVRPDDREALLALLGLAQDDPPDAIMLVRRLIALEADSEDLKSWRLQLRELCRRVGDTDGALEQSLELIRENTDDVKLLEQGITDLELDSQFDATIGYLARLRTLESSRSGQIFARMAENASRVGRIDEALGWWRQAIEAGEPLASCAMSIEAVSLADGRIADAVDAIELRLSDVDLAQRPGLLIRKARLLEQTEIDAERAYSAWREVLSIDDSSLEALWALEARSGGVSKASYRWQLVDNLAESDPRRVELLRLLAGSEQGEAAVKAWRLILKVLPHDSAATGALARLTSLGDYTDGLDSMQTRELVLAADKLAGDRGDLDGALAALDEAYRRSPADYDIYRRLLAVLEAREAWSEVVRYSETYLEHEGNVQFRQSVLLHLAHVHEQRCGDLPNALNAVLRAAREGGEGSFLGYEVQRLAQACGRWQEALAVWHDRAKGDTATALDAKRRLASWYSGPVQEPEKARGLLQQCVAEASEHVPTLRLYASLLEAPDPNWFETMERLVRCLEPGNERIGYLLRLASQLGRHGHSERERQRAIACFRQVLETGRSIQAATEGLLELFADEGDFDGALSLWTDVRSRFEGRVRSEFAWLVAELAGRCERYSEQADLIGQAMDAGMKSPLAVYALCDVLIRLERWGDLAELQEGQADVPHAPSVDWLLKAALTQRDRIGDTGHAVRLFQRALETQPQNLRALTGCADLVDGMEGEGYALRLARILPVDSSEIAIHLSRAAGSENLQIKLEALEFWRLISPDDADVQTRLQSAREEQGDWKEAARLLAPLAESDVDSRRRLGRLKLERLGDVDGGLSDLVTVYLKTDDGADFLAVRRAMELAGKWVQLAEFIGQTAATVQPEAAIDMLAEGIIILRDKASDLVRAAQFCVDGYIQYDDEERFGALGDSLVQDVASRRILTQGWGMRLASGDDAGRLRLAAWRLPSEQADAVELLTPMLEKTPPNLAACRLLNGCEIDSRLRATVILGLLNADNNRVSRVALLTEFVGLYPDSGTDLKDVISRYEQLLDLEPENTRTFDAYVEFCESVGRFSDAADVLRRWVNVADEQHAVALKRRRGRNLACIGERRKDALSEWASVIEHLVADELNQFLDIAQAVDDQASVYLALSSQLAGSLSSQARDDVLKQLVALGDDGFGDESSRLTHRRQLLETDPDDLSNVISYLQMAVNTVEIVPVLESACQRLVDLDEADDVDVILSVCRENGLRRFERMCEQRLLDLEPDIERIEALCQSQFGDVSRAARIDLGYKSHSLSKVRDCVTVLITDEPDNDAIPALLTRVFQMTLHARDGLEDAIELYGRSRLPDRQLNSFLKGVDAPGETDALVRRVLQALVGLQTPHPSLAAFVASGVLSGISVKDLGDIVDADVHRTACQPTLQAILFEGGHDQAYKASCAAVLLSWFDVASVGADVLNWCVDEMVGGPEIHLQIGRYALEAAQNELGQKALDSVIESAEGALWLDASLLVLGTNGVWPVDHLMELAQRVAAVYPNDVRAIEPALKVLKAGGERQIVLKSLLSEIQADAVPDTPEDAERYLEAAQMALVEGRSELSIRLLESVAAGESRAVLAEEALLDTYSAVGQWSKRARLLERFYDRASGDARPDIAIELSRSLEKAERPDEALLFLQSAMDEGGDADRIQVDVVRLYVDALDDYSAAADAMLSLASRSRSTERTERYQLALSYLLKVDGRDHSVANLLGSPDWAGSLSEASFSADVVKTLASTQSIADALATGMKDHESWSLEVRLACRIARQAIAEGYPAIARLYLGFVAEADRDDDWRDLQRAVLDALSAWGQLAHFEATLLDAQPSFEALWRIGELHFRSGGQDSEALSFILQAFAVAPKVDLVAPRLDELCRRTGEWDRAVSALEGALAEPVSELDQCAAYRWVARWHGMGTRSAEGLATAYRALLSLERPNSPVFSEFESMLESLSEWSVLVDVVESRLGMKLTRARRAELTSRIVNVTIDELNDHGRARQLVEACFEAGVSAPELVRQYTLCLEALDDWESLFKLRQADGLDTPSQMLDLARLADERLGDSNRATELYLLVRDREPGNQAANQALYERLQDGEARLSHLVIMATHASGPAEFALWREASELAGALDEQELLYATALERCMRLRPKDVDVFGQLRAYYRSIDDWPRVVKLEKAGLESGLVKDNWHNRVELARIYYERLRKPFKAGEFVSNSEPDDAVTPHQCEFTYALFTELGYWAKARDILELARERGFEPKSQWCVRLIALLRDQLGCRADAFEVALAAWRSGVYVQTVLDAMADLLAGVAEQLTRAMDEGYLEEAPVAAALPAFFSRFELFRGARHT